MNYLPGFEPINKKIIFDKISNIILNKTPFKYAYVDNDIKEINFSDRSYRDYGVVIIQAQVILNFVESEDIVKSVEEKLKAKIPFSHINVPRLSFLCSSTYRGYGTKYSFWFKLDKDEMLIYNQKETD